MKLLDDNHDLGCASGEDGASGWAYKPAFGIVHSTNCAICRSYMIHVVVANHSDDASFKDAVNDRDSLLSGAFLDGAQSGRELQQEHDVPVLARYQAERDEALKSLEQHRKMLDAAKKELDVLRDQVLALNIALDGKNRPRSSVGSNVSSLERLLLSPTVDLDDVEELATPSSAMTSNQALPMISDQSVPGVGKPSQGALAACRAAGIVEHQKEKNFSAAASSSSRAVTPPTPPAPKALPVQHFTPTSTQTAQSPQPPTTHAQLQSLMKSAHAGDEASLTRVKAFCASAHQTPREHRTELQRYALTNWRSPRSASPLQDGIFSAEIHVDASGWGIGFVMDGLWLAWKFSDSLALSGNMVDISWAEMLAVEVGLWTVIQWANMQRWKDGQPLAFDILVRSDNAGVVKAIEKRHANYAPQQDILQRIFDMTSDYDIQLTMKWVSSMDNLADNPSRGVPGLGATLLPLENPVPSHLSSILSPIQQLFTAAGIRT
jgi:hypothetical protein